jgi:hypothetical protein
MNSRPRNLAVVGWVSFLVASVGTMLFFAWIDPMTLAEIADAPLPDDRMSGYAIGFFFFWIICAAAGGLTCYMMSTLHEEEPPQD